MRTSIPLGRVLAALVTVCAAGPARAELWGSALGDLLRDARRVEVVEVLAHTPNGTSLRVVESLRGHAVGSVGTLLVEHVSPVTVGERVLLVCDRTVCPRAVGRLRHGVYVLRAYEPGDGAWVFPPMAAPASVAALTRGAPAPALCLRASVALAPAPTELAVQLSAARGEGTARAGLVPHALAATMRGDTGRGDGLELLLSHGAARQRLVGDVAGRDADGCVRLAVTAPAPLARTPDELRENLTAAPRARPIARGTATFTRGAPVPAGTYPLALEAGPGGDLWLAGLPGIGRAPTYYRSDTTSLEVGYPRAGADNAAALRLRFVVAPPGPRDVPRMVLDAVARGPLSVELLAGSDDRAPVVGRARLSGTGP